VRPVARIRWHRRCIAARSLAAMARRPNLPPGTESDMSFPTLNSLQSANITGGIDRAAARIREGADAKTIADEVAELILKEVNDLDANKEYDGPAPELVGKDYEGKFKDLIKKLVVSADGGTINKDEVEALEDMHGFNMIKRTLSQISTATKNDGEFWYGDDVDDTLSTIRMSEDAMKVVDEYK
jgi:hypothetical protein